MADLSWPVPSQQYRRRGTCHLRGVDIDEEMSADLGGKCAQNKAHLLMIPQLQLSHLDSNFTHARPTPLDTPVAHN
jgi:hypothetical protein